MIYQPWPDVRWWEAFIVPIAMIAAKHKLNMHNDVDFEIATEIFIKQTSKN